MSLDQVIMDDGVKLRGETLYFAGWASGQYRSAARLHDGPEGMVGEGVTAY